LGTDEPPMLPLTPGFDVVGTVLECGELARGQGFKAGQRVAGLVRTGGNARYCVLSSELCVRVPGEIDSDEAACLTSTFVTAYQALNMGKSGYNLKGAKILLLGGPDPIFQAMIEMAMLGGASIVYTVTSPKNHAFVKSFGATPLPQDKKRWLPIVQGQIDICIDSMCEDGFESPRAALNTTGKLVCIGMTSIINTRTAAEDSFVESVESPDP
jgi:NADPH:quinone reductase-like Zn-dependent oxidoreductase